jgi:translin
MPIKILNTIASDIEKNLDEKDAARERAIISSRKLIRLSKSIISSVHQKNKISGKVEKIKSEAKKLRNLLRTYPDIYHSGLVEVALQEVAEACLFFALMKNKRLPTPREINVTPEAYLLGLGDLIGELRRAFLDASREGDLTTAEKILSTMEEVFEILMRFSYPDALLPLRKKQDLARGLIERTRGELAVAAREKLLKEKLDTVIRSISKVQNHRGRRSKKRRRSGRKK